MHELSLALAILEMAGKEVAKSNGGKVCELTLEVGVFSGVDAEALEFALAMSVKNTIFEGSSIRIIPKEGKGICANCGNEFGMAETWSRCPRCSGPADRIVQGEELRFLSLTVED